MNKYIVSTIWWEKDGTSYKRTKEYKTKSYAMKYYHDEITRVSVKHGYLVTMSCGHNNPEIFIKYPNKQKIER